MNKTGKSNAIFIILIPIFLILALIIVDTIISYAENKRFKSTTEKIVNEVITNEDISYEDYEKEIKRLYERNNYDTKMLVVDANDYEVYVENEHNYFGLFSSLKKANSKKLDIKILGVTFKVKRNSKAFIKLTVKKDYDGNLKFEYAK